MRCPDPVSDRCLCGLAVALLLTALSIGFVKHIMLSRGGTGAHANNIAAEKRTP
jgi:hypothetical protein